ncbi:transglycosylase SLT domain-containing protein [Erwinia sp. E602]|uniref:lytic transglycosylase domain-containing protein n=1 Tax=Erwinia sp. E602 TaxID=2675378 RepID=UPI001BABF0B2|nr:transglycosylase SLT domain-containing protein [Erwinia sp. E602]QUG75968.1 transglycosylase SLT domain-containing protein [Erwinia sp. E602]
MSVETIKDFLVGLGFQIDDAGARKFEATLAGVTAQAAKVAVAVEASALAVVAFTAKIASGLDNLYWAGQRTGATVQGIQQIGFAVSQMGGSVDAARASLESLSRFVRNNPGAEGFLNRLGVQTRDASGNMRDMASIFTGVGQRLSTMPYYRANQYAQMLGIDENTLMAMRRGVGQFSAQYSQMAKAIGYNADTAAVSSNKFMTSLNSFAQMAGMARDKIGSNLAEGLTGSLDSLRKLVLDNFPKIEGVITSGIKGLLWLADVIGRVIFRLMEAAGEIMDWWDGLDKSTKQLIEIFGGLVVAWRVLNSAFLTSPIGIITALGVAILALYDDYKTWKEGGKSLIDWAKWEPEITSAINGIVDLRDKVLALLNIDPQTWTAKWDLSNLTQNLGGLVKMLDGIARLLNAIKDGRWSDAYAVGRELLQQGSDQPDALPAVTDSANGAADWLQNKTGFDPRSIGRWARSQFGGRPEPTKAGAAVLGWLQPTLSSLENLYRLPEGVLRGVALAESNGDQFAVGPKTKYGQAKGMFQIVDGTAHELGLRGNDVFDPVKSAQAAAKYLSQLLQANGGDLPKALASYNWGIGNVQKHGMALMPQETRNYIPRVMSNMPGGGINQETNIHIHGVSDPMQAAREVSERQINVNSRLVQSIETDPR